MTRTQHDPSPREQSRMRLTITTITILAILVLAFFLALTPSALALNVGDRAPVLTIDEWVQGASVDLSRQIGSRIFMVEFWATWCPPCKASVPRLTQLQNKYKNDLTIIGVTAVDDRGNTPSAVRRFVRKQGENMSYTVALDKGLTTTTAYMGDSVLVGIPYAYLIARDGRIAWHGSPLDPSLDEVVDSLVSGGFDFSAAKVAAEVEQRFRALEPLLQMGRWSAVWDGLIGVLKLDPAEETALQLMLAMYLEGKKDAQAFRSWASAHIEANRDKAKAMERLAALLCSNPNLEARFPDLALEAARAAYEASNKRDASVLAVYAQALYQIGDVDRAIELQVAAVGVANGDERDAMQKVLDYYNLCKQLQGT